MLVSKVFHNIVWFQSDDQSWHFEMWWLVTKIDTCVSNANNTYYYLEQLWNVFKRFD